MTASSSPATDGPRSDTPIAYYFPEEIIELVLSKCPVKSVVRFKSASKSWQLIISDTRFTKTHRIQRSQLQENQNKYILLLVLPPKEEDGGAAAHIYVLKSESDNHILNIECVLPYPSSIINVEPLSSCNGLILLTQKGYINNIQQQNYILWNPSIRKHTIITRPRSSGRRRRHLELQRFFDRCKWQPHLYYDSTTDDHKIVFYDERLVYSCNKGSWSGIKDIPNYDRCGCFFDGCFYSIRNREIVCFDTRDGNLHKFRQPDEAELEGGNLLVDDLSERLHLYGRRKGDDKNSAWALEKHGSFEKWVEESTSYLYWKVFNMEEKKEKEEVADLIVTLNLCGVKYNESRIFHESRIFLYSETLYMP